MRGFIARPITRPGSSSLRLPEGDGSAARRGEDAAPACGPLPRRLHHRGAQHAACFVVSASSATST